MSSILRSLVKKDHPVPIIALIGAATIISLDIFGVVRVDWFRLIVIAADIAGSMAFVLRAIQHENPWRIVLCEIGAAVLAVSFFIDIYRWVNTVGAS